MKKQQVLKTKKLSLEDLAVVVGGYGDAPLIFDQEDGEEYVFDTDEDKLTFVSKFYLIKFGWVEFYGY